jgi:hypothetical protein
VLAIRSAFYIEISATIDLPFGARILPDWRREEDFVFVPIVFGVLSAAFLGLSVATGTPPARRAWRRIGIIFAAVTLLIIAIQHKLI